MDWKTSFNFVYYLKWRNVDWLLGCHSICLEIFLQSFVLVLLILINQFLHNVDQVFITWFFLTIPLRELILWMTEVYVIIIVEFYNICRIKVSGIIHDKIQWHPKSYQDVLFDEIADNFRSSFLGRLSFHPLGEVFCSSDDIQVTKQRRRIDWSSIDKSPLLKGAFYYNLLEGQGK